jgi:hypothetical protein
VVEKSSTSSSRARQEADEKAAELGISCIKRLVEIVVMILENNMQLQEQQLLSADL